MVNTPNSTDTDDTEVLSVEEVNWKRRKPFTTLAQEEEYWISLGNCSQEKTTTLVWSYIIIIKFF